MSAAMRQIATAVANKHGIPVEGLISGRRRATARIRQEAMYLMVEEKRWSLPRIGMFFAKDHTTVLHGHRAHKKRLAEAAAADLAAWGAAA